MRLAVRKEQCPRRPRYRRDSRYTSSFRVRNDLEISSRESRVRLGKTTCHVSRRWRYRHHTERSIIPLRLFTPLKLRHRVWGTSRVLITCFQPVHTTARLYMPHIPLVQLNKHSLHWPLQIESTRSSNQSIPPLLNSSKTQAMSSCKTKWPSSGPN